MAKSLTLSGGHTPYSDLLENASEIRVLFSENVTIPSSIRLVVWTTVCVFGISDICLCTAGIFDDRACR